jgi:hypothetical protein
VKNITLAIDEETLTIGREYARRHRMSLNSLVRRLLGQTVRAYSARWLDDAFGLMDRAAGSSRGSRWTRGDLHRG